MYLKVIWCPFPAPPPRLSFTTDFNLCAIQEVNYPRLLLKGQYLEVIVVKR